MKLARGTIIAVPPGPGEPAWRFFVLGCRCAEVPSILRHRHATLPEAEACAAHVRGLAQSKRVG